MSVMNITASDFDRLVLQSDRTVLLDFWAEWCGPCRMLSPIVEEIATEHPEIMVGKVNVDAEPDLASRFGVMSIPALFVICNGQVVDQATGARPKNQVLNLLRSAEKRLR